MLLGCSFCLLFIFMCSESSVITHAQEKESSSGGRIAGQLQIQTPKTPLKLGKESEVPLMLHERNARLIHIKLSYYDGKGFLEPPDADLVCPILTHADGSTYVEVTPEKSGKVQISITVDFVDGTYDTQFMDTEVTLPNEKPTRFVVVSSGSMASRTIYLDLSTDRNHIRLFPKAYYANETRPVPIPLKNVTFRIILPVSAQGDSAPIALDTTTGMVTAHHIGHALIETKFGDLSSLTCIGVLEDRDDGSDKTDCLELVPAGMGGSETTPKNSSALPVIRPRSNH
jgi:hypothetical protein